MPRRIPYNRTFRPLGGEKSVWFPPPAIFRHQSFMMPFWHEIFRSSIKAYLQLKYCVSPVSTPINTFWGTLKINKIWKFVQNIGNFWKMDYSERNIGDRGKYSSDQNLLKVSKEHVCIARIKFLEHMKECWKCQIFWKFNKLPRILKFHFETCLPGTR